MKSARSRRSGVRRILATVPRRSRLLLGSVTAVNVANQMYLIAIAPYVTKDLRLSASLVGVMAGAPTGAVAARAGYRSVFWTCAGLCALAVVLLLFRTALSRRPAGSPPTGRTWTGKD
ncbi:hypothetical protein [Streptomyces sp. NPDC055632]